MIKYHKINTVFKRDQQGKIIEGEWSQPEFEYLAYNNWTFTEKVDGTNIRVILDNRNVVVGGISFGGKTDKAQLSSQLVNKLRSLFPSAATLKSIFDADTVCLYGEGYGTGIQKGGGNYSHEQDFVLFDIKVGDWWLNRQDVEDVANKLGLRIEPISGEGTLYEAIHIVKNGITSTWGDFQAEGIVARPKVELATRGGNRIITKIKVRDFN